MSINKINIKVGIDFGKTIGLTEEEEPYPNCIDVIRFLKNRYGVENIFIISKARQQMRLKITAWLNRIKFFETTNILRENLIFCNDYVDKTKIVERLGINVFIDDHIKVIQSMVGLKQIKMIIWFNKKVDIKLIEKQYRPKIVITNRWDRIVKIFHKINLILN